MSGPADMKKEEKETDFVPPAFPQFRDTGLGDVMRENENRIVQWNQARQ